MQRRPHINSHGGQTGLTLIELLIAIAVGLVLIAGLLGVLVFSGQTDRLMGESARMQENARFALDAIGRELRMAGCRSDITTPVASIFPADSKFPAAGQIINGTNNSISLRYQGSPDGTVRDCLGNPVPAGTTVTIDFSVVDQELICQSSLGGSTALVDRVGELRVRYGMNGSAGYADATAVTNWAAVTSLNVELLFVSERDGVTTGQQAYTIGGVTHTPTDRRLRRVYGAVVTLRNHP